MARKRSARRGRGSGAGSAPTLPQGTFAFDSATLGTSASAGEAAFVLDEVLILRNTGTGAFTNPSITDDAAWLTLAIVTNADGSFTITPTVDPSALSAGTYTGTITATDSNASNSGVTATVTLVVSAAVPSIRLSRSSLSLSVAAGGASATQSIVIDNGAEGTLATPTIGTITYSGVFTGWVNTPAITDNGDGTYTLTFIADAGSGSAGSYTATIQVVSDGASNTPEILTVNLTVVSAQQALLAVSRSLDDVRGTVGGSNPVSQSVGVFSANQFPLSGPTIDATSYSGTSSGWATATLTGTTLTVDFDISGIASAGTSYFNVDLVDASAANTARYSIVLSIDQSSPVPAISVAPPALGPSVIVGSNHGNQSVIITNVNGTLADLGTITTSLSPIANWANVSLSGGTVTVSYNTASLPQGSYSTTLQIAASLAGNSPVNVPIILTVSPLPSGDYPVPPPIYQPPGGYTWDASLGYPTGSIFNTLPNYRGADNDVLPTFAGTEYVVTSLSEWNTARANLANGTIVDGDIITISAGLALPALQLPKRPGWVYGDSGFVWIRTSGHASLPAYVANQGPASHGDAQRAKRASHAASMFSARVTETSSSALCLQGDAGGYWITGCDFRGEEPDNRQFCVVEIRAYNGTTRAPQNTLASTPSCIVLDRCLILPGVNGAQNLVKPDGRHIVVRNCDLGIARDPAATLTMTLECHGVHLLNSPGPIAVLGSKFGASGIGFFVGGGTPSISQLIPQDVVNMYNDIWNDPLSHEQPDGDDYKNAIEHKTGRRFIHAFNDCRYWPWHSQQQFCFVIKAVDQSGTGAYAAHTTDVVFWGNRLRDSTKGFIQCTDIADNTSPATIGVERICVGYNLHIFSPDYVQPRHVPVSRDTIRNVMFLNGAVARGRGIPDVLGLHNTYSAIWVGPDGGSQSWMNISSTPRTPPEWTNFTWRDNVCFGGVRYGPVFGNGGNTAGLNTFMGVGGWSVRRNYVELSANGQPWDATLAGGNNQNSTIPGSQVFTNPAAMNYSIIATASDASASFPGGGGGTDGTDCGYDHAYLIAMLGDRA